MLFVILLCSQDRRYNQLSMKKLWTLIIVTGVGLSAHAKALNIVKTDTVKSVVQNKDVLKLNVKLAKLQLDLTTVQNRIPDDEEKVKSTADDARDALKTSRDKAAGAVDGDAGDAKKAAKAAKKAARATKDAEKASQKLQDDQDKVKKLNSQIEELKKRSTCCNKIPQRMPNLYFINLSLTKHAGNIAGIMHLRR